MQSYKVLTSYLSLLALIVSVHSEWLPKSCPVIISRTEWGAKVAKKVEYSTIPLNYVVIHHTVTPTCDDETECSDLLTNMQYFHMNDLGFYDIGYNFLIGGDGYVYEGTGWHKVGAHTLGYNSRSLGIAFVGTFMDKLPNRNQLNTAKRLLQCAVDMGELSDRYKLIGGLQVSSTKSPGLKLYREIQKWPHFASVP